MSRNGNLLRFGQAWCRDRPLEGPTYGIPLSRTEQRMEGALGGVEADDGNPDFSSRSQAGLGRPAIGWLFKVWRPAFQGLQRSPPGT